MLEASLLQRIDEKKQRLDQIRPLPTSAIQRLQEQLSLEWIYHSNAIEGNTLTLRETQFVLQTGLTIGGKSLREHFEVINHRDAIVFVEALVAQGEPVTPFQVRQIHAFVLKGIDDESAGQFRQLPVRIAGVAHQPPEAWEVPSLMAEWGMWLAGSAQQLHPVERASIAHHQLAAIHPFIDGNGRTARLVMNLLLLKDGFPTTVIRKENRRQYYRTLSQADGGNAKPFVNFVGREVERSLTLYLDAVTPQTSPVAADERWMTLREASESVPYSQEYLSLLARTGRLEAIKRGQVWYTTQRAMDEYRRSLSP